MCGSSLRSVRALDKVPTMCYLFRLLILRNGPCSNAPCSLALDVEVIMLWKCGCSNGRKSSRTKGWQNDHAEGAVECSGSGVKQAYHALRMMKINNCSSCCKLWYWSCIRSISLSIGANFLMVLKMSTLASTSWAFLWWCDIILHWHGYMQLQLSRLTIYILNFRYFQEFHIIKA